MKTIHSTAIAVSLAVLMVSAPALAQHRGNFRGGGHFGLGLAIGLGIGLPLYGYRPYPDYYPPAYGYAPYYYPPAAVAPAAPPVYIERQDQPQLQAQPQAQVTQNDYFYCPDSKTFYPYVQQCASEWQRVPSHPPGR